MWLAPGYLAGIVPSALAALAAAVFVLGYDGAHYHDAVEHLGTGLPAFTACVHGAAWWALAVPALVLGAGLLCLRLQVRRELALAIVTNVGWLFAIVWPLTCILAWRMPFMLMGSG